MPVSVYVVLEVNAMLIAQYPILQDYTTRPRPTYDTQ